MGKKRFGTLLFGAAVGAGLGVLFAPKKGSETRKELKEKFDDLLQQVKEMDTEEVKKEFNKKIKEIKKELAELDQEKVLDVAKSTGNDLKAKAQDLVDLAIEKGTPILRDASEELRQKVIEVSKEVTARLEKEEKKETTKEVTKAAKKETK